MILKIFSNIFIFSLLIINSSCNFDKNYFPNNEGKQVFYDVFFKDKENNKKYYRQSFFFLPTMDNAIPVLKHDGDITFYVFGKKGITKKSREEFLSNKLDNENNQLLIAYPIVKNTVWETDDKTTLQMKLGYDRVYNTDLPLKLRNEILETDESLTINGRKIDNCIKISGYGKTSYNPGPPLGNINIEVFSSSWYSKDYGLVKYIREEKSDSETMGTIIYEKTMLIDD